MKFTVEREVDSKIPFLDILIHRRDDGSLNFDVYRKPTSTDRYLDYNSYNPISHKMNTIKTLQKRAFTVCSDESNKIAELNLIKNQLINNGYPRKLIEKCETEVTMPSSRRQEETNRIIVPYIKGVSERVGKLLKKYDTSLVFRASNTLRNKLCSLKDKVPDTEKKNIIYKLNCNDCSSVYIGESSRNAGIRVAEHRRDIENRKISNNMFQHNAEYGHNFDLNNVQILASETRTYPRKFMEACYSKFDVDSINRAIDIPSCYLNIVKENTT